MLANEIHKIADASPDEIKELTLKVIEIAYAHGVTNLNISPNELPAEHYAAVYAHRLERMVTAGAKFLGVRESVSALQSEGKAGVRIGLINTPSESAIIFLSGSLTEVIGAMIFEKTEK